MIFKAFIKYLFNRKEANNVMINLFAMQVTLGWLKVEDIPEGVGKVTRFKGLGEMENDQLKYFLVDEKTRNIIQVEYPSDVDEFNRIMGSSSGKYELLKELNILE